ncbi:Uncharacterized membrane protein, DUF485 family [Prauserella aidingensis]|uniref:DUF485 domain-containing protein n=1 Tax=Prauserella aidingensis TaxID=387890 RepID=UPI0020A409C3|nr:DUF485 domain-containing protein [Prauserella aidingensis]MCP2253630.1 Uncharacterized membrane protein, DUF485 family [Prauserella aidingensis]
MAARSPYPVDANALRLAGELRKRRRYLVAKLGLPSLACYLAYLSLVTFGQSFLRIGVPGGLSVGWVLTAVMLLLPLVVCALFARGARRSLDRLRESEAGEASGR